MHVRALHTAAILRSVIKRSTDKTPKGGAGMAAGDLARTKAATVGNKYHHLPEGYVVNLRSPRYYELAGAGVDRPHAGWDKWQYDQDIVATISKDVEKKTTAKTTTKRKSKA